MSYEAIVARVSTREFPGADRLQLGTAAGYQVIVGKDTKDGELGIVFPEGGKLSHEFCLANGLYRKDPVTGIPLGGYLDENARIRALKMRGQVSEALWLPLPALLAFMKRGDRPWAEGDTVGEPLCEKYYTPATLRAMAQGGAQSKKVRAGDALPRHYDTPQLRRSPLPSGIAYISEKIHGTSGRTGYVPVEQSLGLLARAWNWLAPKSLAFKPRKRLEFISGTRNCVLLDGAPGEKGMGYRQDVHQWICASLKPNEVWYYEIAGYTEGGAPIMGPHHVDSIGDPKLEKELRKQYGDTIVYSYGCKPDGPILLDHPAPRFRVFVYRIVQDGRELPWAEMCLRAEECGFNVPTSGVVDLADWEGREDELREAIDRATRDASAESLKHPREGVCIRVETVMPDGEIKVHKALKHKGFVFCALEGIARNDKDFVDVEEVA